jgi:hypothetical protein
MGLGGRRDGREIQLEGFYSNACEYNTSASVKKTSLTQAH